MSQRDAHEALVERVAKAINGDDYDAMLHEARAYSGEPNGASAWREQARAVIAICGGGIERDYGRNVRCGMG